jgi:hypothetical protein
MKKFTTAVFAAFIALALSMPAWSQGGNTQTPATKGQDSKDTKKDASKKDSKKNSKKSKKKDDKKDTPSK